MSVADTISHLPETRSSLPMSVFVIARFITFGKISLLRSRRAIFYIFVFFNNYSVRI